MSLHITHRARKMHSAILVVLIYASAPFTSGDVNSYSLTEMCSKDVHLDREELSEVHITATSGESFYTWPSRDCVLTFYAPTHKSLIFNFLHEKEDDCRTWIKIRDVDTALTTEMCEIAEKYTVETHRNVAWLTFHSDNTFLPDDYDFYVSSYFELGPGGRCDEGQYVCDNSRCVDPPLTCNERNNCGDWSDEGDEADCDAGDAASVVITVGLFIFGGFGAGFATYVLVKQRMMRQRRLQQQQAAANAAQYPGGGNPFYQSQQAPASPAFKHQHPTVNAVPGQVPIVQDTTGYPSGQGGANYSGTTSFSTQASTQQGYVHPHAQYFHQSPNQAPTQQYPAGPYQTISTHPHQPFPTQPFPVTQSEIKSSSMPTPYSPYNNDSRNPPSANLEQAPYPPPASRHEPSTTDYEQPPAHPSSPSSGAAPTKEPLPQSHPSHPPQLPQSYPSHPPTTVGPVPDDAPPSTARMDTMPPSPQRREYTFSEAPPPGRRNLEDSNPDSYAYETPNAPPPSYNDVYKG